MSKKDQTHVKLWANEIELLLHSLEKLDDKHLNVIYQETKSRLYKRLLRAGDRA